MAFTLATHLCGGRCSLSGVMQRTAKRAAEEVVVSVPSTQVGRDLLSGAEATELIGRLEGRSYYRAENCEPMKRGLRIGHDWLTGARRRLRQ
jgi:hypothetical protein